MWGRNCENCVTFLMFCVLKGTLTHTCYKIIQYAFLIPRTSDWCNSYKSDSSRGCTYRHTCTFTLQRISLTCLWLPSTSEAEGLFQGPLLAPCGNSSALDTYIHVDLLISATDRSFYWSVAICMTVLIGIRMWA